MAQENYLGLKIIEALPLAMYRPEGGEETLHRMRGATIRRIGGTDEGDLEGGGLLIDYVRPGEREEWRVVFAFNELGLWTVWEGPIPMRGSAVKSQFAEEKGSATAKRRPVRSRKNSAVP